MEELAAREPEFVLVDHPTVAEQTNEHHFPPRSSVKTCMGDKSSGGSNLDSHHKVDRSEPLPPNLGSSISYPRNAESREPAPAEVGTEASEAPDLTPVAAALRLKALVQSVRRTLRDITQMRCQYQTTLSVLEKASEHSIWIKKVALPPPISKETLKSMDRATEEAHSLCSPTSTSGLDISVQTELLNSMFDMVLLIKGTFVRLDPIWVCSSCTHMRLQELREASNLTDRSTHPAMGLDPLDLKDLEDVSKAYDQPSWSPISWGKLWARKIQELKVKTKGNLDLAINHLFLFNRTKLIHERLCIIDPGRGRETRFPTCLVSEYDLWQIKPLLKRGFEICSLRVGQVKFIRHYTVLIEANKTAKLILDTFEHLNESKGQANAYDVARALITLLKRAADPSYLVIPDIEEDLPEE